MEKLGLVLYMVSEHEGKGRAQLPKHETTMRAVSMEGTRMQTDLVKQFPRDSYSDLQPRDTLPCVVQ